LKQTFHILRDDRAARMLGMAALNGELFRDLTDAPTWTAAAILSERPFAATTASARDRLPVEVRTTTACGGE